MFFVVVLLIPIIVLFVNGCFLLCLRPHPRPLSKREEVLTLILATTFCNLKSDLLFFRFIFIFTR